MYKFFTTATLLLCSSLLFAQHRLTIKVEQAGNREALAAATIVLQPGNRSVTTDSSGTAVINNLPAGNFRVSVSYVGYESFQQNIQVPFQGVFEIQLEPGEEEEEEVVVQSTRTSRNIRNVPTRVETIEFEEIDEKSNMRPANVAMLLHESTGMQVQQTSATSGNASIRIQGLDGRYTQLLKDGFASFGNFASGLSVLEIPPLDLKQVEIIKGPASPLYGAGAIAGVVNFISKTPKEKAENSLLLNVSNIGQTNLGYYSSKRNKKTGYSFLGLVSGQRLYDVDHDDFTEVPKTFEFTLHPKLFLYPGANSQLIIGNSFSKARRKGGDVQVIRGKADGYHRYFEENNTIRNTTTVEWQQKMKKNLTLTAKTGFSLFDRHIEVPDYHFDGTSYNSFTDASVLINRDKHDVVAGMSVVYDRFRENGNSGLKRDSRLTTVGLYGQDTWDLSEKIKMETGLRIERADYQNKGYWQGEAFILPRVSVLVTYSNAVSSRIGGGLGYKAPTMFTEQTESMQYQQVQPLAGVRSERSYGGTADVNVRLRAGANWEMAFNQLFFYTQINRPMVLQTVSSTSVAFVNATKPVQSRGFETNAKFIYRKDFKLFLGYTYTDAVAKYLPGNQFLPLLPRHKLNTALIYEKERFLKLGFEAYHTSTQYLYNGTKTSSYWELGFMAEKIWKTFSVYINFENFTDTRQSRYKRVANDPHMNPVFDDIWTHTEGFVINGGIKLRL